MTKSRMLSASVAMIYLIVAYRSGEFGSVSTVVFGNGVNGGSLLFLSMMCIWFSEDMGSFIGFMQGRYIDQKSPGCLVAFLGWILLLLPGAILITQYFSAK